MKKIFMIICGMILLCSNVYSYNGDHPPYKFKDGPYRHAPDKRVPEDKIPQFMKDVPDWKYAPNRDVYRLDDDNNGTDDYVAFLCPSANSANTEIHIFLKKREGGYKYISYIYDAYGFVEDIVDINNDGKWEIILTGDYMKDKHSYFSYSIYEIKDYRLVNVDSKFKGFPKFVWFTINPNDKDTTHLTQEERKRHVARKNNSFEYRDIKDALNSGH